MASQHPLRILSLDGGGVRGLASLHILKELMAQVRRQLQLEHRLGPRVPDLRPCDYFDLICGTSTGGLIALMLGRLRYVSYYGEDMIFCTGLTWLLQDIEMAIKHYCQLSEAIFTSTSPNPRALFDHRVLEECVKRVIREAPISIPLPMLFRASMPKTKKFALIGLFYCGLFVTIAAILRVIFIATVSHPNQRGSCPFWI